MNEQTWYCEVCKKRGTIKFGDDDAGVISVIKKLNGHHRKHSPDCTADINILRPHAPREIVQLVSTLRAVD